MAKKVTKSYGSDKPDPVKNDDQNPSADEVMNFHTNSDLDTRPESQHHTLGANPAQASPGDHSHDGGTSPLLLPGFTITGSRGGNVALQSVIAALVRLGVNDNSTT
jgi:hypothetical protein